MLVRLSTAKPNFYQVEIERRECQLSHHGDQSYIGFRNWLRLRSLTPQSFAWSFKDVGINHGYKITYESLLEELT